MLTLFLSYSSVQISRTLCKLATFWTSGVLQGKRHLLWSAHESTEHSMLIYVQPYSDVSTVLGQVWSSSSVICFNLRQFIACYIRNDISNMHSVFVDNFFSGCQLYLALIGTVLFQTLCKKVLNTMFTSPSRFASASYFIHTSIWGIPNKGRFFNIRLCKTGL